MTNQTTTFRKRIDFLIKCALILKTSAETTLAWRSLQMAKAWLGEAMRSMALPSGSWADGQPLYNAADNPGLIPPTSDTYEGDLPETLTGLDGINYMRQKISEINLVFPQEEEQKRCFQKAQDYLTEARMWYGFELANMRASNAREVDEKELKSWMDKAISGELPVGEVYPHFSGHGIDGFDRGFEARKWPDPLEPNAEEQTPLPDETPEFTDEELEAIVPINGTQANLSLEDDVEKIDEGLNFSGKKKGKKK